MAKFSDGLQSIAGSEKVTLPLLKNSIGKHTESAVMAIPLDESKGNIQQFNFLKAAYKRIWDKFFGDSIVGQQVADFIFNAFIAHLPAAEKSLIEWICGKLKIPIQDELTEELVVALNDLIDDEAAFYEEFTAILLTKTMNKWQRAMWWISKTLKNIFK